MPATRSAAPVASAASAASAASGANGARRSRWRPRVPGVGPQVILGCLAWSLLCGASLRWNLSATQRTVRELALAEARASFEKDVAYRRWAALMGGLYVPAEAVPPNPYLRVPHRDVETTSGRRLTLVNPAYMTRQVHELSRESYGLKGHITSLRPLRPENAPDAWERRALERIEAGAQELDEVVEYEGEPHLRFIRRLAPEERCAGCHPSSARLEPEVRGGVSVSVPLATYAQAYAGEVHGHLALHAGVWILGLAAILTTGRGTIVRQRERDAAAAAVLAAQERTAEARRLEALGQLAGSFAHDVNNLLSPILGFAEMALDDVPAGHRLREDLGEVRNAAQRARDLTRRLLAFSRRSVLAKRPVDLSEVVSGVLKMLESAAGEQVTLEVALAAGLPSVMADTAELEVALLNLVVNARDAMPDGGTLRVRTGEVTLPAARGELRPGRYVSLVVSDTGLGMDEVTARRVFEPFFTTKPAGKGTGLGLASVQGAVQQHGGSVTVQSEPGRGTTFEILLPACDAAAEPARPVDDATPRGSETVLVAEDDPSVRQYVAAALRGLGYAVLTATDGEEALRIARGHEPPIPLIVSDLVMPRLGGLDLQARVALELPGVRVLLMSGYTSHSEGERLRRGGTAVLAKPFTRGELARAVRGALDRPAEARRA